mgnify:CR=1 FL=1
MLHRYGSLAFFLLLTVAAGYIGASFEAGEWYYETLKKPAWTPPAWLFGPVWAVLYPLMAISAWKVWLTGHHERLGALTWWGIQLLLNAAWSWLFFGLHRIGWAWAEMTVLVLAVLLCTRAFFLLSRHAAYLMVPYLVWLIYAWVLNFTMWSMNGGVFGRLLFG